MSSRASAARPSRHTLPIRAAAVSIVCLALTAASYAVAAAASANHGRKAPGPPTQQNVPAKPAGDSRPAATSAPTAAGKPSEAPSSAAAPAPGPVNQAASRQAASSGKPGGCCGAKAHARAQQQRAAGADSEGKGRHAGQPRHATANANGAGASKAASKAGGASGEAATQNAALAPAISAHGHRKGRHGKESTAKEPTAKEPKSKETKAKETNSRASVAPLLVPASAAAATTSSAVAPAPVLPAPTAAVVAPRIVAQSPSTSSGSLGRRSRRHRSARRGAKPVTVTGRPAAVGGAVARAPAPVVAATRRSSPVSRPPARAAQSQLATTVTKIINVIPALVWAVMGALAALALLLAASSRVVALRARRLARQRRELLEDVGLLQAALLPALPGRLGPVGTSAAYRPASGPGAGGDFYDVFALADGQLAVIVGDVSGHGRHALPHTTLLRFTLRAYLEAGLSPRGALQAAAPTLERQIGDSFATVVLATYQPRDRILVYSCAGHPPPIVSGGRSLAALTACSSPPIGAGQPTGRRQTVVSVPGEALACFYTDGVIEARVGPELFGAPRLERTIADLGPEADAATVLDRVAEQSDRHPDDMAACVLHIDGEPLAPQVETEELELDRRDLERGRAERFLRAGGVQADELAEILRSVRTAVGRHGGVVVELHLGDGPPEVLLRPQNVALLHPPALATAEAVG
jgi:serine phosphatase RsbU (regulator of sigma subunit)